MRLSAVFFWIRNNAADSRISGARKGPRICPAAKPCLYRVVLDIANHALLLNRIANPAVKIVSAPECPCSTKKRICGLGAGNFDPRDYSGDFHCGAKHHVNMVRHHYPRSQFIKALFLPFEQRIHHGPGYVGTGWPLRPCGSHVEQAIKRDEFGPLVRPDVRNLLRRKRTRKTPCEKARSGAVPVREADRQLYRADPVRGLQC